MNRAALRRVERALKTALVLTAAALTAMSVLLGLLAWRSARAAARWNAPGRSPGLLALDGQVMTSFASLAMPPFPQRKEPGELRIFVLGGSQAMGSPYVIQDLAPLVGLKMRVNEGGLATWLERYLARALPGRRVRVVNAAGAGADLAQAVEIMADVVSLGQPDAFVLLTGDNERPPSLDGLVLPKRLDLVGTVRALTGRYRAGLWKAAALAARARVRLYVLTVPDNLRDWWPFEANADVDPSRLIRTLAQEGPKAGWQALSRCRFDGPDDPMRWAMIGKILVAEGRFAQARRAFVKAKDLDRGFLRARSPWNEAIRRLNGPGVAVVDAEKLLAGYSPDGIPGAELFHDYCHLTLRGNRILGFELARRVAPDLGASGPPVRLDDVELGAFATTHLKLLLGLKALKWTLAARANLLGQAERANAEATASAYAAAANALQTEIDAYRKDARRGPPSP